MTRLRKNGSGAPCNLPMEMKQVYVLLKVLYRLSSKASNCGTAVPLLLRRTPDGP
jgi:hypothetical protein